jgi:hypothetical protein
VIKKKRIFYSILKDAALNQARAEVEGKGRGKRGKILEILLLFFCKFCLARCKYASQYFISLIS